jgi:hypothetical protein
MSSVASLVALLLLASSPGEMAGEVASPAAPVEKVARPPHELRKAIHEALKRSAPASDPDPYTASPGLISLYEELRADTQIEQFDRKRLQGLLRMRLLSMVEQLENPSRAKTGNTPAPQSVKTRGDVLAQQGLPPGAGFGAGAPNPAGNAIGPQGGIPDYGPLLVDLIKKTIAPSTWDDAGGPGTIYYYRPLRVLVIRQTGNVHEQIGGVMGNLRGK